MSPASQLSPGPKLNEAQLGSKTSPCGSTDLTRRLALEGQGWEPSAQVGAMPQGTDNRGRSRRVWGQWYRQERKWEMENRTGEPTELGRGAVS